MTLPWQTGRSVNINAFFFSRKKKTGFQMGLIWVIFSHPSPLPPICCQGKPARKFCSRKHFKRGSGKGREENGSQHGRKDGPPPVQYSLYWTVLLVPGKSEPLWFDGDDFFFFFNLSMFDSMSSIGQGWHTRVLIWRHGTTVWLTTVSRVRWIASLFQPGLARL